MRWLFAELSGEIFFHGIHWISYKKKETFIHGSEPLTFCMSTTSGFTAPFATYFNDVSCEFEMSVEISAVKICKASNFSGEFFFTAFCWYRWKNFFHCLSVEKKFHRLKNFFTPFIALSAILTLLLKFTVNLTSFSSFKGWQWIKETQHTDNI